MAQTDKKLIRFTKKLEKMVLLYGKTKVIQEISKVLDLDCHVHSHDELLSCCGNHHHEEDKEIVIQKHYEIHKHNEGE